MSASRTISCAVVTSIRTDRSQDLQSDTGIDRLVYFEVYDTAYNVIQREKNIEHGPRAWKTRLIAQSNPAWRDLYEEIVSTNWNRRDKPGEDRGSGGSGSPYRHSTFLIS